MSPASRRKFLTAAGVGMAGALVGSPAASAAETASSRPSGPQRSATELISCYGTHQAGVTTPAQRALLLAGFDVKTTSRAELVELLRAWQTVIERLTAGRPAGSSRALDKAPGDTGEATGQGPARLTVTLGFGPSLFDQRFGLASRRPAALIDLPRFKGDALDPALCNGDISVQACADQQTVTEHAIRDLARAGRGVVSLRWQRGGFNEPPTVPSTGTGRNLLGFKDGTANLDGQDEARMRTNVWVARSDGPSWMTGGTYQVYRKVNLHIEKWDESVLDEQQDTFGRYKTSGAPYGGHHEFDPVNVALQPKTSHIRLANPRTGPASEAERILRRGYNFHDGYDVSARAYAAGLTFIAYQRDPRKQFVTIQRRLAAADALNEYIQHTASGIFAVPPGVRQGDYVGSRLFA